MALRYRRLKEISRVLPHIYSGNCYKKSGLAINLLAPTIHFPEQANGRTSRRAWHAQRFSTISQVSHESPPEVVDILSYIESTLNELEGPYHCWLNRADKDLFKRNGTFLILAGQFLERSSVTGCIPVIMIEKVKFLQQRFPQLYVMGFQPGSTICSSADQTHLVQLIMKEYVTFPILLSNKHFSEISDGAYYILLRDFRSPVIYTEKDLDLEILNKAIEEINMHNNGNSRSLFNGWKQTEAIKELNFCSLQKLLLYFPGCIFADEGGNRLFLSDSNHHRIIIFDGNGKILDCIGSSPGFEDGVFESAKLMRPAASFYDASEDCLYFVDSENHAIRRADMGRRALETLYPIWKTSKKNNKLWTWIMDKLGLGRDIETESEEFDSQSLMFPWHLMKSADNSFLIINSRFETLWIMDSASGRIKEVVEGFPKIAEICGELIMEKVSLLTKLPRGLLQEQTNTHCSPEGIPYAGLISSCTTFQNYIIIADTVGQRVLKLNRESGVFSNFQLSNFGVLGLPYWMSFPLERVYAVGDGVQGVQIDHLQCFTLLPGKIDIQLTVDIPMDTELVEQLHESCIWRQARGAATEVSGAEGVGESTLKVGEAQKWYDELDSLAFSTSETEMTVKEDSKSSDMNFQDGRVNIDCTVNTSPGSSEVIFYAPLYLKLKRNPDLQAENQEKCAAKIAYILNSERSGRMGKASFIQYLLRSNIDLRDLIFIKPLHVRIKLDSLNHPKADNSKVITLTDSSVEVNVSL